MKQLRIGVQVVEETVPATIDAIVRAEALGIDAVWLTLGGVRPDSVAIFAAAAVRTSRVQLGTSIVPTYPRHPLALAQEARVVAELAPGRFRLGVGPSHPASIEGMWGIPYRKPLSHLREYLHLLKAALQQGGQVAFDGQFFHVRADCGHPVDLRVMASGLRGRAFELIGELADGGLSWVCPLRQIEQVALPAMRAGAAKAGRNRPAMIMHLGVSVHEDAAEVRAATLKQFGFYPRAPLYQRMFAEAGFPEATQGVLSERMVDAIVAYGDEAAVARHFERIAAAGVEEVICSVIPAGRDPGASAQRTLQCLGSLSG
ncbi:MAG: LLM class flavin-dependent oxidoreductase [Chloroflexi bacterium]|nr:LLM class flavin-dependent oxidoreductase [Chloroflexota bacterium]